MHFSIYRTSPQLVLGGQHSCIFYNSMCVCGILRVIIDSFIYLHKISKIPANQRYNKISVVVISEAQWLMVWFIAPAQRIGSCLFLSDKTSGSFK